MSIVTTSELDALIGTPRVRLFDVRADLADPAEGRRRYEAGHIPGAVFVDLETDLTGDEGPGRHPLPRPEEFSDTARRLGIGPDTFAVAYDDVGGVWASRLWWMLTSLGHTEAAVLDGGIVAWEAEGRPVTRAVPNVTPGDFHTRTEWTGVVDRQVVGAAPVLVDARAPARFRGEVEPIDPVAGHIPGAVNLPYADNLDERMRFLPPEALSARFADLGADPVVYCGSGVSACHDLLAMRVAGIEGARLYEGSWSDWCRQPGASVATGP